MSTDETAARLRALELEAAEAKERALKAEEELSEMRAAERGRVSAALVERALREEYARQGGLVEGVEEALFLMTGVRSGATFSADEKGGVEVRDRTGDHQSVGEFVDAWLSKHHAYTSGRGQAIAQGPKKILRPSGGIQAEMRRLMVEEGLGSVEAARRVGIPG